MSPETAALIERVKRDPEFHALVRRRSRLAWGLTALTIAVYFGFILLVAFAPEFLARPIGTATTTIGIPAGVGVILTAFALTGIYVRRANSEFDAAMAHIVERAS